MGFREQGNMVTDYFLGTREQKHILGNREHKENVAGNKVREHGPHPLQEVLDNLVIS